MTRARLLLLGGTTEGAALARRLEGDDRLSVITSLAGRTRRHHAPAGDLRIGGFGGADGLAAYLREERIDLVIDATHPFASRMAGNAHAACDSAACPRIKIIRPPWEEAPGDRWVRVADAQAAAAWLDGRQERVLLTVGRQELPAFERVSGPCLLARMIDPPDAPTTIRIVLGRGPFTLADEERLLREHGVTVLVSKNSGGAETMAKIEAARRRSIPVLMIERPAPPPGERVATADEAARWVERWIEDRHG